MTDFIDFVTSCKNQQFDAYFLLIQVLQCFFFTKGLAFHVTANFHIIGSLTGWSYFSMSFDTQFSKLTGPQTLTCLQFYSIHNNK